MYTLNHYSKNGFLGSLYNNLINLVGDVDVDINIILSSMFNNIIRRQSEWSYLRKSSEIGIENMMLSLTDAILEHTKCTNIKTLVESFIGDAKMYYFTFSNIIVIVRGGIKSILTLNRNLKDGNEILINEFYVSNDAMIQLVSELRVEAKMISRLFDETIKD
jgi:hypothetical protein